MPLAAQFHVGAAMGSLLKLSTGRRAYKVDGFFIKLYEDANECVYERRVLVGIAKARPSLFCVPKVVKMNTDPNGPSMIIMERIKGIPLHSLITKFLLLKDFKAIEILHVIGRALKELHDLNLEGLQNSNLPSSLLSLKLEILRFSKILEKSHVLDHALSKLIIDTAEEIDHVDDKFFTFVNLHGEFYFTHTLLSGEKCVFLDFHNACRGPSYFDIAMFSTSLYVSLTLPFSTPKQLEPLIEAFLTGFYKKDLDAEIISSMKLAELYVTLREILMCARTLYIKDSLATNLLVTLKIKRLKSAIKEVILPKLTA